jgi:hypothetical protein
VVSKKVLDTNAILFGGKLAQALRAGEYFISVVSEIELLSIRCSMNLNI